MVRKKKNRQEADQKVSTLCSMLTSTPQHNSRLSSAATLWFLRYPQSSSSSSTCTAHVDVRRLLQPWCWYCDREFIDEPTLVQHQKSKHFKCPDCNRKLNTAQGLSVHAYQVHKRTITE